MRLLISLFLIAVVGAAATTEADDWRQWRGVDRLGVWHETGILEQFPNEGLKVTWRVPIGSGYAGPAVADGRVFVLDWVEDPQTRTLEKIRADIVALENETDGLLGEIIGETSR